MGEVDMENIVSSSRSRLRRFITGYRQSANFSSLPSSLQNILCSNAFFGFGFGTSPDRKLGSRAPQIAPSIRTVKSCLIRTKAPPSTKFAGSDLLRSIVCFQPERIKSVAGGDAGEFSDEDDDLCPVDCVREFKTDAEFFGILEKSKETGSLVVVDFFRTSCGSCKYIEQGFAKVCKGAGDEDAPVIFLKHNVIDEYDEQSEVAERLRIKTVPLFHFYKDGVLLEAFPTRDKEKIIAAILKYTSPPPQHT